MLLESGLLPDFLIRRRIRALLKQRLAGEDQKDVEINSRRLSAFIARMDKSPLALATRAANEQHYELPSRFFEICLGPRLKYSCCYYASPAGTLRQAEERMLALTAKRAALHNGERILELGCGWGSLALWNARRYTKSSILAVSNSRYQKAYIDSRARDLGLKNLKVITADMNDFKAPGTFDRVVSVEMFEHMRNWRELFRRVSTWMRARATFFLHIFTHKSFAYPFEVHDNSDWMAKYFFTGGMMPSDSLPLYFQEHLKVVHHWRVSGRHYERTSRDWLRNMDANKAEVMDIFRQNYGPGQARRWFVYWRIFFMACQELWGYDAGREWGVSHYLFQKL